MFCSIKILSLFVKSFVNPFVDIVLTFYDSSFNSFLFEVAFLVKFVKICLFYEIGNIIYAY